MHNARHEVTEGPCGALCGCLPCHAAKLPRCAEGAMPFREAAMSCREAATDAHFLQPGSFQVSGEQYKGGFREKVPCITQKLQGAMLRSCFAMQTSCRKIPISWDPGLSRCQGSDTRQRSPAAFATRPRAMRC